MSEAYNSRDGALWIQPDGPNGEVYFLGCHDLADLTEPEGDIELIRCFDPKGSGWVVKGETRAVPDNVSASVEGLLFKTRDWLEKVSCPFGLYALMRGGGRSDLFQNYERGFVLTNVRRTQKAYANLVAREEENASTLTADLEAYELIQIEELEVVRLTTSENAAANDIIANDDERCLGEESEIELGDTFEIATDDGTYMATADVLRSTDGGDNIAATATDPFAAGNDIMSVTKFYISKDTIRILVAMDAPAGAQGMVAYSDDNGATWTTVNVGGAAAGHGAVYGGGLFSLDSEHIWLAGAGGYIYFSSDGGETWTAQEAGVIHAGNYNYVHFYDENFGIAVGASDVVAVTSDGGETWTAGTATGGGNNLLCCAALSKNRVWVGDDAGDLYYSYDFLATAPAQRGAWEGSGTGEIRDFWWVDEYIGFMAHNNASPVGTILRTINGGRHWDVLTTPTNQGLNAIYAVSENLAYAVGETQGGTAVVLKIRAKN